MAPGIIPDGTFEPVVDQIEAGFHGLTVMEGAAISQAVSLKRIADDLSAMRDFWAAGVRPAIGPAAAPGLDGIGGFMIPFRGT